MLSKPDALLVAVRRNLGGSFRGGIDAAFPVVRRLPIHVAMRPMVFVVIAMLGLWYFLPEPRGETVFWALYVLAIPLVLLMAARGKQKGIVVVTADQLTVLALPKGRFSQAEVIGKIPRTTPLPPARWFRHSVYGGPLPFDSGETSGNGTAGNTQDSERAWYYAGHTAKLGGGSFLELVNGLIDEQKTEPRLPL